MTGGVVTLPNNCTTVASTTTLTSFGASTVISAAGGKELVSGKHDRYYIKLVYVNSENATQVQGETFTITPSIVAKADSTASQTLADTIISTYGTDTNLYYHTTDTSKYRNGEGSITSINPNNDESATYVSLNAGDNSYRYAGPEGTYFYIPAQYNGGTNGQLYTQNQLYNNANTLMTTLISNGANIVPQSQTEISIDGTTYNMGTQAEQAMQALITAGYLAMTNFTMNNYVCFGASNESTCLNDTSNNGTSKYLYRIIGVFDDGSGNYVTKLIMANPLYNSATSESKFKWDRRGDYHSNEWRNASLKQWLNGETLKSGAEEYYPATSFLSNYTSTWTNKILPYTWYVRGMSDSSFNAKSVYTQEIYNVKNSVNGYTTTNQNTSPILTNTKVGLMYVSDYMYAASPAYWNYPAFADVGLSSFNDAATSNWLIREAVFGNERWTISPDADTGDMAWKASGSVVGFDIAVTYAVLPVVNLSSDIEIDAGATSADGSPSHPYILKVE